MKRYLNLILCTLLFSAGFIVKPVSFIIPVALGLFIMSQLEEKKISNLILTLLFISVAFILKTWWGFKIFGSYYFMLVGIVIMIFSGLLFLIIVTIRKDKIWHVLIICILWGFAEYLSSRFISYPGLDLSFGFSYYSIFDVFLIVGDYPLASIPILIISICIAYYFSKREQKYLVIVFFIIVLSWVSGIFVKHNIYPENIEAIETYTLTEKRCLIKSIETSKIKIISIQPNGAPYIWALGMTDISGDIILLPELALASASQNQNLVKKSVSETSTNRNIPIISGIIEYESNEIYYNSIILFKDGEERIVYQKRNLLPIIERDFKKGKKKEIVTIKNRKFGFLICFDAFFIKNSKRSGVLKADYMLVPAHIKPAWGKQIKNDFEHSIDIQQRLFGKPYIVCNEFGDGPFLKK